MPEHRPPSVELRIEREPGGSSRSIPLSRGARAALAAGGLALLAALLTAAAVLPSALAAMRAAREHDLQLDRRVQLGNRLRALVDDLTGLETAVRGLEGEILRAREITGVPAAAAVAPAAAVATAAEAESIFASSIVHGRRLAGELAARLDRIDVELAALAAWERDHAEQFAALPLRRPFTVDLVVPIHGYGVRRAVAGGSELEFHAGVDLALPAGTPILAAAPGLVLWAGEAPPSAGPTWWRLGRVVVVRHGEDWLTLHGHLGALRVVRGQRVRAGATLAEVGASGWAPAPQLHYEVRRRGAGDQWQPLDPMLLLGLAPAPQVAGGGGTPGIAPEPLPRVFTR